MGSIPEDKRLYEMFEEQGRLLLPKSLMSHLDDDIHELVIGVKGVISLTLAQKPDANVDVERQVICKLEAWRNTKEKHIAFDSYVEFARKNGITHKKISFRDFVEPRYFEKWKRIEELGIKIGSVIRVKGYGDTLTIRGISGHLSIGVEETSQHFNPDQIITVIKK